MLVLTISLLIHMAVGMSVIQPPWPKRADNKKNQYLRVCGTELTRKLISVCNGCVKRKRGPVAGADNHYGAHAGMFQEQADRNNQFINVDADNFQKSETTVLKYSSNDTGHFLNLRAEQAQFLPHLGHRTSQYSAPSWPISGWRSVHPERSPRAGPRSKRSYITEECCEHMCSYETLLEFCDDCD